MTNQNKLINAPDPPFKRSHNIWNIILGSIAVALFVPVMIWLVRLAVLLYAGP
jgi:hypothetical protein